MRRIILATIIFSLLIAKVLHAQSIKLGFMAQSPTGKNCKVTFSNITYSTKKIKDPYTGE
jgi:hypothetical protein